MIVMKVPITAQRSTFSLNNKKESFSLNNKKERTSISGGSMRPISSTFVTVVFSRAR